MDCSFKTGLSDPISPRDFQATGHWIQLFTANAYMVPTGHTLKKKVVCVEETWSIPFFSLNPLTSHVIKKSPKKIFDRFAESCMHQNIITAALKSFRYDHFKQVFWTIVVLDYWIIKQWQSHGPKKSMEDLEEWITLRSQCGIVSYLASEATVLAKNIIKLPR